MKYGTGNAKYNTISSADQTVNVDLGLGANNTKIGSVQFVRSGNSLGVTVTTNPPYSMGTVQINVGTDVPPATSSPGQFTNPYTVSPPANTFTTTIDITSFAGNAITVVLHADILSA